jgi:hypothetical protein
MQAVTHTTHVPQAVDIIRKGNITAGLVYDESILRRHRIRVVWVSPNYWHNGFRYGTVQFEFNFRDLLEEMQAYYVETAEYNTPAPRILLTDRDRGNLLAPYDPKKRDGPWWHQGDPGKHYFNNRYTLELMLEADVDISLARKINFVTHHDQFCSVHRNNPKACNELGCQSSRAGAYFVARIVGEKLGSKIITLLTEDSAPSSTLRSAWSSLETRLRRLVTEQAGRMKADHDSAGAVSRALLRAYGARDTKDLKALGALFKSKEAMMEAVQATVESAFELNEGALSEA